MDRRTTIKSLFLSSVAGGLVLKGCTTPEPDAPVTESTSEDQGYGRTDKEKLRDQKLAEEQFFMDNELETLAVLCDIILPATADFGSATDAGVPEFIEFMAKDLPGHQLPLRGGLMWLDNRSNAKFNMVFRSLNDQQQIEIVDEIAYPQDEPSELTPGISFFNLMRNLTLTGYYTTKMGLTELGYVGNKPSVWEGVPDDVLKEHGLSYDPEWEARFVDQSKRNEVAQWDEDGNLIT